jgi:tetratricopeptide (TPR) repeat protein
MERLDMGLLDALATAVFEDPAAGLALAQQNPVADSARYWAIVGTASHQLNRHDAASSAFHQAHEIPAPPFDRAEVFRRAAGFHLQSHQWAAARAAVAAAIEIHGSRGLSGPVDRGLAAALISRGYVEFYAHLQTGGGDLYQAAADFRRALKIAPDPRSAPLTHLAAIHNTALLSLETGLGLPDAQRTLAEAAANLRALGFAQSSLPAARTKWALIVVDWVFLGSSDEVGVRFNNRIEAGLVAAHQHLYKGGAVHDAVMVHMDLGLLYLEQRNRKGPAPRWDALRELSLEIYKLDWQASPEVSGALMLWRQAALEESFPAAALHDVYSQIRGLRKPDPRIHAHGTRWGGDLRPTPQSLSYRLAQNPGSPPI